MIEAIIQKNSLREFTKFLITGATNTLVDFAVLNLCFVVFGLMQGDPRYVYFKAIAYICASVNSFALNKWWVFKNKSEADKKEIGTFAAVSGVGLVLNTVVSLIVFQLGHVFFPAMNTHLLANIAAVAGTLTVLLMNFSAYKFIVFKK